MNQFEQWLNDQIQEAAGFVKKYSDPHTAVNYDHWQGRQTALIGAQLAYEKMSEQHEQRIAQLEAENALYREALQNIVDHDIGKEWDIPSIVIDIARDALKEGSEAENARLHEMLDAGLEIDERPLSKPNASYEVTLRIEGIEKGKPSRPIEDDESEA